MTLDKNTEIVLRPCCAWEIVQTAISKDMDISVVPGCHLLRQISFWWGSQKLPQRLVSHELTVYLSVFNLFLTQLSNFFEPHNSQTLLYKYSRLLIQFCRFWIFPWIKLSWHSCSMWDKLGWFKWFGPFLCKGLSSFNPKRSYYSYSWPCSLCEWRTSPFAPDVSLENFAKFYLCFRLALFYSLSFFFFLYWSPSLLLCTHGFLFCFIYHRWDTLDQTIY